MYCKLCRWYHYSDNIYCNSHEWCGVMHNPKAYDETMDYVGHPVYNATATLKGFYSGNILNVLNTIAPKDEEVRGFVLNSKHSCPFFEKKPTLWQRICGLFKEKK